MAGHQNTDPEAIFRSQQQRREYNEIRGRQQQEIRGQQHEIKGQQQEIRGQQEIIRQQPEARGRPQQDFRSQQQEIRGQQQQQQQHETIGQKFEIRRPQQGIRGPYQETRGQHQESRGLPQEFRQHQNIIDSNQDLRGQKQASEQEFGLPRYVLAFLRHMEAHKEYLKWNIAEGSHKLTLTLTWNFRRNRTKESLWGRLRRSLKMKRQFGETGPSSGKQTDDEEVPYNVSKFLEENGASQGSRITKRTRPLSDPLTDSFESTSQRHLERRRQHQAAVRQHWGSRGSSQSLPSRKVSQPDNITMKNYNSGYSTANAESAEDSDNDQFYENTSRLRARNFASSHSLPASVVARYQGAVSEPESGSIYPRQTSGTVSPFHCSWHGASFDTASDDRIDDQSMTLTSSPVSPATAAATSPWSSRRNGRLSAASDGWTRDGWGVRELSVDGTSANHDIPEDDRMMLRVMAATDDLTPELSSEGNDYSSAATMPAEGYRGYISQYGPGGISMDPFPRGTSAAASDSNSNRETSISSATASAAGSVDCRPNFQVGAIPEPSPWMTSSDGDSSTARGTSNDENRRRRRREDGRYGRSSSINSMLMEEQRQKFGVRYIQVEGRDRNNISSYRQNSEVNSGDKWNERPRPHNGNTSDLYSEPHVVSGAHYRDPPLQMMPRHQLGPTPAARSTQSMQASRVRSTPSIEMQPQPRQRMASQESTARNKQLNKEPNPGPINTKKHASLEHLEPKRRLPTSLLYGKSMDCLTFNSRLTREIDNLSVDQSITRSRMGPNGSRRPGYQSMRIRAGDVEDEASNNMPVNLTVLKCLDSCDKILYRHSTTIT